MTGTDQFDMEPMNNPPAAEASESITAENERNEETNSDTTQQPDQEPENPTPIDALTPQHVGPNIQENTNSQEHENLIFLTSSEEHVNDWQQSDQPMAWRCEFEIPWSQEHSNHACSSTDNWIMLATSAKKQRTEVRLTELTTEERKLFDDAKNAEVQNWLQTGTITKVLRNQFPRTDPQVPMDPHVETS